MGRYETRNLLPEYARYLVRKGLSSAANETFDVVSKLSRNRVA
jgi:hypothetical protein